ncbi:MAG: sulfatase-like hydrolase/transferase [Acidobacteriaceae bacterium]
MLKKLGQCLGVASLILVMSYGDLLGGGYDARMHVPFALNGIVWAQLADIVLLGLALFAVIWPLSRTRFYAWVKLLLALLVPPYLLEVLRAEVPVHVGRGTFLLIAIAWVALVLLMLLKYNAAYRRLIRVGDFAGVFFTVFCACSMLQLLWVLRWTPGPHERTATWESTVQRARAQPREHPRLVWVVLDELSYEQVYGHRADDLALPNFDALRAESTVYTDAQPIGDRTVKIIPSLLSGHLITAVNFTFDNRFVVHDRGMSGFTELAGAQTVFGDAQKSGWRTAAVGWYNPYCTVFAGAIDDCYWMNHDRMDGPMAQDASFWSNVWSPLKQTAEQIAMPTRADQDMCTYGVQQRYKTYVDLTQHAAEVLKTDQADFVFLHLPVPHSPNIWNRMRGQYTQRCGSSYLDSLALADRELGEILATLKSSPRWKDTTLIVEGDHSWRTYLWNDQPAWTAEDEQASRAGFDPRPAVIVHHAGQTQAELNATPWSLLNVHSVVEQVLHGNAGQQ